MKLTFDGNLIYFMFKAEAHLSVICVLFLHDFGVIDQ